MGEWELDFNDKLLTQVLLSKDVACKCHIMPNNNNNNKAFKSQTSWVG